MKTRPRHTANGFTLVEMIIVVALISIVMIMAINVLPGVVKQSRADGAAAVALNTLRLARDRAIGERRNIDLVFTPPKRMQVVREEIGGAPNTTLVDISLENDQTFLYYTGMVDTPDLFGLVNKPIAFGTTQGTIPTIMFTSEGTMVDTNGDPLNGTLFLGSPNDSDKTAARAITVFGATALLRMWKWDGVKWIE